MFKQIVFKLSIKLINCIPFTHFFSLKRKLLNISGVVCGESVKIAGKVKLTSNNIEIGNNSWIGDNFTIYNSKDSKVIIGSNVDIAPNCVICTGTHELGDFERRAGNGYNESVVIKDGVWIGINSTILHGVMIEEGAVVAAGSIVIKNVKGNIIVGGVPAKEIKKIDEV